MSLKKRKVLFLDLQTTGAKPDTANILEIAWSTLHSEKVESYLVAQPEGQTVPRRIQFITGIGDEDLGQAKSLSEVLALLSEYLLQEISSDENPLAVIHFAQFEKPFLLDAYEKIQKDLPFTILCTHEIAKRLLPNLPTRGIKGLAGYFGFPAGELKRASNHVQATQVIWQGLTSVLAEQNILTLNDLDQWLNVTPKAARNKYEYPLSKEKRLGLPKQPGVYRMISKWGEVLYVGKATSLHDRVNSYFRGQKNRDPRKLEMLTQVWDLQVTPLGSPLEAALFETDEIKRLDPRYNVSLKTGNRSLTFFNHDFTSMNIGYDDEHPIGPFSNPLVLDSMIKLSFSVETGIFNENMFFDPLAPELIKAGFEIFCERHQLQASKFSSVRSILAVGLNWVRKLKENAVDTEELPPEENNGGSDADANANPHGIDNDKGNGIGGANANVVESNGNDIADTNAIACAAILIAAEVENNGNTAEALLSVVELTPEDIANKFERHFIRTATAYLRSKKLTRLLNADICFKLKNKGKKESILKIRHGQVIQEEPHFQPIASWKDLSIDTYDRMTVLNTELEKMKSQNNSVKIMKYYSQKHSL